MRRARSFATLASVASVAALAFGSAAAFAPSAAQDATPAACPATSEEENAALVRAWFAALPGGDWEAVAALAAADVVYHDPGGETAAQTEDAGEWAGERQQDYADLAIEVEQVVVDGDLVASYQRWAGTQQSDVEEGLGVAPGTRVEWVSMGLFRVACGKIAEVWSVADDLGRLQRLGVISDDELQSIEPAAAATPAP